MYIKLSKVSGTILFILLSVLSSCKKDSGSPSNPSSDTYIKYSLGGKTYQYAKQADHVSSTAPGCRIDTANRITLNGQPTTTYYTLVGEIIDSHDASSFSFSTRQQAGKLSVTTYSYSEGVPVDLWFPIVPNDGSPQWTGNDTIYKLAKPFSLTITEANNGVYSGTFTGTVSGTIRSNLGQTVGTASSNISGEFKNVKFLP